MFCPKCGAEFREGYERCADCGVALVAEAPVDESEPMVTVFETSDPAVIPVVKSLLDSSEVPYRTHGDSMMNLFPSEALGALLHQSAGDFVIQVPASRAEEVRQLLRDDAQVQSDDEELDDSPDAA